MKDIELRSRILLAFQVALLGMIPPRLRGVAVGWDSCSITGVFLYDSVVTTEEEEIVSDVEAEIIASFPDFIVNLKAVSREQPFSLDLGGFKAWVYRRME